MAEIISCPSCQRKLQVPETLAGQDVQCPTCGATFVAKVAGASGPTYSRESEVERDRWDSDRDRRPDDRRPYSDGRDPYKGSDDYSDEPTKRRRRDFAPHRGALILCLGLIGLLTGILILCPIAWILGNADMTEIRAGRMDPEGEGLTQAGRICGIIGTVFMGLVFCFCGLMFFMALATPGGRM